MTCFIERIIGGLVFGTGLFPGFGSITWIEEGIYIIGLCSPAMIKRNFLEKKKDFVFLLLFAFLDNSLVSSGRMQHYIL